MSNTEHKKISLLKSNDKNLENLRTSMSIESDVVNNIKDSFSVSKVDLEKLSNSLEFQSSISDLKSVSETFSKIFSPESRKNILSFIENISNIGHELNNIRIQYSPALLELTKSLEKIGPFFEALDKARGGSKYLSEGQILAHTTTPWHLFKHENPQSFSKDVLDYYDNNWNYVSTMFLENISEYSLSSETKIVFAEALKAHELGLYRSSVSVLFPAIEAEYKLLYGYEKWDKLDGWSGNFVSKVNESRHNEVIFEASMTKLLKTVNKHLYLSVTTENSYKKFIDNDIPNRNAAIHGVISYSKAVHSLNTLIISDYMFFLMNLHKITKELEAQNVV
jgi:hypothetical protein